MQMDFELENKYIFDVFVCVCCFLFNLDFLERFIFLIFIVVVLLILVLGNNF